jgi:hypothetical protein
MVSRAVLLPRLELGFRRLEIEVGVEEGVIGDLPEWIDVAIAGPELRGTSVDRLEQHPKGGMVLALEGGLSHASPPWRQYHLKHGMMPS